VIINNFDERSMQASDLYLGKKIEFPLLSFSATVTISLIQDQHMVHTLSEKLTHILSPFLRTVPIPHSMAYRLSLLKSLAITYLWGWRPLV
jgi:hypothetical protein